MNGISCNYNALIDYNINLNNDFKTIKETIFQFENSFKNITMLSNWNSEVRDYIVKAEANLSENFVIIENLINNINQYVDSVINNYQAIEEQMKLNFGG